MASFQEPSLIDYARFHVIASDFTSFDPLDYIDEKFELGNQQPPEDTLSEFRSCLNDAHGTLNEKILGEKLRVSKESGRFLASVLHEARARMDMDWDALLPTFNPIEGNKLEPPIFTIERAADFKSSKNRFRYSLQEIDMEALEQCLGGPPPANSPSNILQKESLPTENVKAEKLKCTRKSLSIIQGVRTYDCLPEKATNELFESILRTNSKDTIEPELPVLLPLNHDLVSTPSPSHISEEYMLPSPVSSDCLNLDLHCRKFGDRETEPRAFIFDIEELDGGSVTASEEEERIYTSPSPLGTCMESTSLSYDRHTECEAEDTESVHDLRSSKEYPPDTLMREDIEYRQTPSKTQLLVLVDNGSSMTRQDCVLRAEDTQELASDLTKQSEEKGLGASYPKTRHLYSHEESQSPRGPDVRDSYYVYHKRKLDNGQVSPRKNRSAGDDDAASRLISQDKNADLSLPGRSLGSLSSFMETRGRLLKRQIPGNSPYFSKSKPNENHLPQNIITKPSAATDQDGANLGEFSTASHTSPPVTTQVPLSPNHHEGLVFFLSTKLLKTHLRLIQCLERTDRAPKLIYRDYANNNNNNNTKHEPNPRANHLKDNRPPREADIIVSPKTGIILTTSQAIMQLYLPGHKPAGAITSRIREINSPLREQIFLLSSRYEHIYVLVSHGTEQTKQSSSENHKITADKCVLASITSLVAFCNSLSGYADIIPLLIPSVPEIAAEWILALAHRHACSLPSPRARIEAPITFTPINQKRQPVSELGIMQESTWGAFLCRMGLNQFAAHVVLVVLRREGGAGSFRGSGDHGTCYFEKEGGYLSRFVEMLPEQRRTLFTELLGQRMLRRIELIIEKDWQCDWALNFHDTTE
ncbi:hypothetical protein AOCH_005935 [Aspergillus ochraceoroseus]|nr:hypothetical protein AOCH_005935 [Aspergillus ochraceoroseus]